jgi:hypothetical protein
MLAVRAHGLWLHAPLPLGRLDLSATIDARLQCEGCYEPEQSAAESWRWTNGHARLRLKAGGAAGTRCQVNVVIGAGRLTAVRWDGAGQGASSAFPVVLDGREVHDLELDSEIFAAQGDARTLGVSLQRVVLECE